MPTYIATRNQAGRVAIIRLNPAWTVAARLHGGAPVAPPRIDTRHWGVDAIVWELHRRYSPLNAKVVFARATVLAKLLTDGGMTEAQIADLPPALLYEWAQRLPTVGGHRYHRDLYEPCFPPQPSP